jgi:hypothetical protein
VGALVAAGKPVVASFGDVAASGGYYIAGGCGGKRREGGGGYSRREMWGRGSVARGQGGRGCWELRGTRQRDAGGVFGS